jgi:hypothetical protein
MTSSIDIEKITKILATGDRRLIYAERLVDIITDGIVPISDEKEAE